MCVCVCVKQETECVCVHTSSVCFIKKTVVLCVMDDVHKHWNGLLCIYTNYS